jgi:Tol biopolymer transport system component
LFVFSCGSAVPPQSDLYLIRPDGSEFQQLTKNIVARHPSWSPDGEWIIFSSESAIYKVRPNGSARQWIIDLSGEGIYGNQYLFTDWSPDGEWIVFSRFIYEDKSVYLVRPDGDDLQVFVEDIRVLVGLSWSPDGALLAIAKDDPTQANELVLVNADGTNMTTIVTHNSFTIGQPTWSPDSKQIAYIKNINDGYAIFIFDMMTGDSHRIPLNFIRATSPEWAPDGEWLAFSTDNQLYKARLDGSGQFPLIGMNSCGIGSISWFSFN